ncbi:DinB family protein [Deinococcus aquatilis]|uniref:DinB family protein n=1 Tax=Deinococcus aquatilis TaxID=519440 RepID=UPI0003779EFB|nr:DinB family protein [Deinococcus aquatilis]
MSQIDFLLESFHRNARVNEVLFEALAPGDFVLSDGLGGWTVERHLRHMARFRSGWLWNIAREYAHPLFDHTQQDAEGDSQWRWQDSPPGELTDALVAGDRAAVQAVQAHLASGEPFVNSSREAAYLSSPAHFLQHTIVHDSHHRGQVMALLRQGGRTKGQMDELDEHWAIWRE